MEDRKYIEEDRNEKLREIMREHKLKPKHVAEILGRKTITVRMWLCRGEKSTRMIPAEVLERLELKLAVKAGK